MPDFVKPFCRTGWDSWILAPMFSNQSGMITLALHLGPITIGVEIWPRSARPDPEHDVPHYTEHPDWGQGDAENDEWELDEWRRVSFSSQTDRETLLLGASARYDEGLVSLGLLLGPFHPQVHIWTRSEFPAAS